MAGRPGFLGTTGNIGCDAKGSGLLFAGAGNGLSGDLTDGRTGAGVG